MANDKIQFVGDAANYDYTYGDIYDFLSSIKKQATELGQRTPLITTLHLVFNLPLPLKTSMYSANGKYYVLYLEKDDNWKIKQKKVDENGNDYIELGLVIQTINSEKSNEAALRVCRDNI